MKDEILINPITGKEYVDVPPKVAAEYLGVAHTLVYEGLKQGRLPIGSAIKGKNGRWTYNIPCRRLKAYANGIDVLQTANLLKALKEAV